MGSRRVSFHSESVTASTAAPRFRGLGSNWVSDIIRAGNELITTSVKSRVRIQRAHVLDHSFVGLTSSTLAEGMRVSRTWISQFEGKILSRDCWPHRLGQNAAI